ncbi:MAG: helicase-exonuclease AddAB subunit AddA [Clostridia bacterium]|nr:helicase-exonuclease AddAB subunit AddA [Clostridia bacterium]
MNLTLEQSKVINTDNKTLLVSASAGSGKTFVVVERILKSIVEDKKDIDSMLIVTFTNAAASELKERIVIKLQEKLEEAYSNKNTELVQHLSKQISRAWGANISTIHSFCLSVIKDNFYILGVDPNISTLDATRANIMLMECIDEVIEEEYENNEEGFRDILDILGSEEELLWFSTKLYDFLAHVVEKGVFKEKVLSTYNIGEDIKDLSETVFGKIVVDNVKSKLEMCKLELDNIITKIEMDDEFLKHREILSMLMNNILKLLNNDKYDDIYNMLAASTSLPNMPRYTGDDIETKENILSIKKKVTDEIKSLSKIMYKDTDGIKQELNSMYTCIRWLFKYYEKIKRVYGEKKKEKGVIDFSDYEELALKALENNEVIDRYKEKFSYIYIDEYQDTSYAQEAIISKISKLDNCIMVGDVKQSIYGFRNAVPELFSTKYEKFSSDTEAEKNNEAKIVLAQNFRSRKEVINSINDIFEKVMTLEFGGSRYTDVEKLSYGNLYDEEKVTTESNPYKTEINIVQYDKSQIDDEEDQLENIEIETNSVAKRIKELVGNFDVYDTKKKEYRKCEYKDIVILLQVASNVADKVSNVLSKNGIPAFSNSKTGFYETDEVKLVMSFLKVIDNPLDDVSLASVMYSIIGKFTLDDLVNIRLKNNKKYLLDSLIEYKNNGKDVELVDKINNFLDLIAYFREYARMYSIPYVITELFNKTPIYEAIAIEKQAEQKKVNLDALIQVAHEFEKTGTSTIYSFIQYVENIKKREGKTDSPRLIGENENVVRIMTIHHSKGLEFPVVILMNMAKTFNFPEIKERILLEDNLGIGLSILDKDLNISYPSVINMSIKAQIKLKQKSEMLRVLYVALTRAKEKLLIYGTVKNYEKYISELYCGIHEGTVLRTSLENNNCHLKNILSAVLAGNQDNFDINLEEYTEELTKTEEFQNITFSDYIEILKRQACELEIAGNKEQIEKKKQKYYFEYEYALSQEILQKYTATQINEIGKDKEEKEAYITELIPNSITVKITNRSFGSIVHKIVERLDITNLDKQTVLEVTDNVFREYDVTLNNKKYVVDKVYKMLEILNTTLLVNPKVIEKEYEFVIQDSKLNEDTELSEKSLIQGIIDLYIEDENRNIIIDFKTDKIDTEQELISKYSSQLNVYKRGIELSLQKKVTDMYIYSFALDRLIKI